MPQGAEQPWAPRHPNKPRHTRERAGARDGGAAVPASYHGAVLGRHHAYLPHPTRTTHTRDKDNTARPQTAMRRQKSGWREAGEGGPLGTRPSPPVPVLLIIILALGLCHCAENPHTAPAPAPPSPSPPPQSQLERAKRILGVTDQPLTDTDSPVHPQDIRKMITSMKKGLFAKKSSKAKVPKDSQGGAASSSKTNQGLIKSILKAVSDGGGGREAEEGTEDRESEAGKKDSPPGTGEGGSEGKGKLVKTISERVSSKKDMPPEQLEMPTDAPPPTEEARVVMTDGKQVDCEGGTVDSAVKSEVPNSVTVTEVMEDERKSVLMEVDISDGGNGDRERGTEDESEVTEVTKESDVKEEESEREKTEAESGRTETEKADDGKETKVSEKTDTEDQTDKDIGEETQAGNMEERKADKEEEERIPADGKEGKEEQEAKGGATTDTSTTATPAKEENEDQQQVPGVDLSVAVLSQSPLPPPPPPEPYPSFPPYPAPQKPPSPPPPEPYPSFPPYPAPQMPPSPPPPEPYPSFQPYPAPQEHPSFAELRRWPSPDIPLVISDLYTSDSIRDIENGLGIIESQTCIRFITAEGDEEAPREHVVITPGMGGCNAVPGYNAIPAYVSVVHLYAPDCLTPVGRVVHEIMHVLGFYHEHQRTDRDSHIIVHDDNILQGHETNFKRMVNQTLGLPYDVASVMHYGPKGFCNDCTRPTISALHGEVGAERMGQRTNLSVTDIARVNRLYGCEGYYVGFDLPGSMPYDPPPPPTEPLPSLPMNWC